MGFCIDVANGIGRAEPGIPFNFEMLHWLSYPKNCYLGAVVSWSGTLAW